MSTTGPALLLFGLPALIIALAVGAYFAFDRLTGHARGADSEEA